jgi:1-acyl-sn-glycerol-3-phosphate acyltransferase
MARGIGTIFIEREKIHAIPQVVGRINEALAEGAGVALFPEGTSGAGDKVLPFYPSLLEPAARANYPVSFASIGYSTSPGEPPAYLAVSWWREVSFGAHLIDLLKLSRFDAFITFGSHAIRADDRKTLAKGLWSAINDQFTPMVDSELLSNEKE